MLEELALNAGLKAKVSPLSISAYERQSLLEIASQILND